MANCFSYKRSTTTKLRAVGCIDLEHGSIITDDGERGILELLSDFNGATVDLSVTIKDETELDLPEGGE